MVHVSKTRSRHTCTKKHVYESGNKRKGMRCTEQIYVWQRQETTLRTPPFVRYLA